jgi:flavin reductase (DIM6/NTAB) family NADH-FMN oxidoreductase RutF
MIVDPKKHSVGQVHSYLLGAVVPRPIAFASTIDKDGNVNLSPFSFFNCFGANPPILIFSPARRGRDNTVKHTYENVLEVPEVVINMVNYDIVQQMSLASTEYPKGVNEFIKSGLTPVASTLVKPPRVGESYASFECKVLQVIPTGLEGAAGNLVICEVILMHIKDEVLDETGKIDPAKMDAVARLGGDWYCRLSSEILFKVPKPLDKLGIGVDQLPMAIRNSRVLTGNDLGMLANIEQLPEGVYASDESIHRQAKELLMDNKITDAWEVLVSNRSAK